MVDACRPPRRSVMAFAKHAELIKITSLALGEPLCTHMVLLMLRMLSTYGRSQRPGCMDNGNSADPQITTLCCCKPFSRPASFELRKHGFTDGVLRTSLSNLLIHLISYAVIIGIRGREGEDKGCRCTAVDHFEADHRLGLCPCMTYLCRNHLEHRSESLVGHPAGHLCDHHVDRPGGQSAEGLVVEHRSARRQNAEGLVVEHRSARRQIVEHQRQEHRSEERPYPRPSHPLLRQSHNFHPGIRDPLVFCSGLIALSGNHMKALDPG